MSIRKKIVIFLAILLILTGCAGVLAIQRIDTQNIIIEGNQKYTNDEMINFIFESDWDRNPFVLYYKTKYGKQKTIPFVDEYEVEIVSLKNVKITVYEKKIIGYFVLKI